MENRLDLQKNIEKVFNEKINKFLSTVDINVEDNKLLDELFDCGYIYIYPPKEEPPMMRMLTLDSLKTYRSGSSIKPGNIILNMKNLIQEMPTILEKTIVVATTIASNNPILKVCAALELWMLLVKVATVNISKLEALVIIALWKNCSNNKIAYDTGFLCVKKLCDDYNEKIINKKEYDKIIESLKSIKCIRLSEDKSEICLIEEIKKGYIDSI